MKRAMTVVLFMVLVGVPLASFAQGDFFVVAVGKRAVRTLLVSPQSTAAASGTALLNTLASITDASASNPYLVIVEPGIFDVGSNSVQMKEYVDIQGSGQNVTTIRGNLDSTSQGVVMGASHAELRNLTVQNTGGGTWAIAVYNQDCAPTLTLITAAASGATNACGVYNSHASPVMTHVTATATDATSNNYGVFNDFCTLTLTQVTATASGGAHSYGVYNQSPSIYSWTRIDHSVITGTTASVYSDTNTCSIGNSRLQWGAVGGSGSTICAGVYDESYSFYPNTCP